MKEKMIEMLMDDPSVLIETVKELMTMYKPVVYDLLQETIVEVYKDYSNNTEFPAIIARTKRNIFEAYLSVGFTEDQAMAILINDNLKLMNNISKASKSTGNNNK